MAQILIDAQSHSEIDELCFALSNAKKTEDEAKKARLEAEQKLVSALEELREKEEGTQSHATKWYSITVNYGVTRSISYADLANVNVPADTLSSVFVPTHKLDLREFKKYRDANPQVYAELAKAVIAKPSKPSIKVTEI